MDVDHVRMHSWQIVGINTAAALITCVTITRHNESGIGKRRVTLGLSISSGKTATDRQTEAKAEPASDVFKGEKRRGA